MRSYVRDGDVDEAEVEVELKGFPGKRNSVIWRRFSRDDEKSEFKLDGMNFRLAVCYSKTHCRTGQPATKKAVSDVVQSFGVQANNLWRVYCCISAQFR